ncbi:MAG: DUF86 domain-containing protein [Planctomycetota bacterium]|nr:DUF86 domain-containing protein [Planctomycetota bacterium]
MQRDDATLLDIECAARRILEYVHGLDQPAFEKDHKTQSAVLHQIMLVGEAAKRLSEPFRAAHPQVPWSEIARTRDFLIHHYDEVDVEAVWSIVETDIPALLRSLAPFVPKRQNGSKG